MKNPIPLLSVALAFVIFGSTYIRNMTCPCNIAAAIPTTSFTVVPIAETSRLSASKEIILNFNYDDNQLDSQQEITKLQEYLQTHANSTIVISGHTDSKGSQDYNRQLSESRAGFVMSLLVRKGVNATKITTQGMGESVPLSPNETEEGRKQNRRVVVQVFG